MDFWKLPLPIRAVLAGVLCLALALGGVSPQALAEAVDEATSDVLVSDAPAVAEQSEREANATDAVDVEVDDGTSGTTEGDVFVDGGASGSATGGQAGADDEGEPSGQSTAEPEQDDQQVVVTTEDVSDLGAQPSADASSSVAPSLGTRSLGARSVQSVTDVRSPQTKDGTTVEDFSLVWNTHDTTDDGSEANLYLAPDDDAQLSMQARLQFAFSGEKNYPAGSIQITVPAQVVRNRDGELIGSMTFGVPEEPDTSQSFAYRLVTPTDGSAPYYVISNTRTLQSGTTGVIQLSIHGITPHEVKSDAKSISDEVSDKLQAELTLTTARGNDIVVGTDPLTAQIHTFERIDNAYKNGGRVMDAADAPDAIKSALNSLDGGADAYVLVRWNTYANVEGNQAFKLSVTDTIGTITANGESVPSTGSVVLGTTDSTSDTPGASYTKVVLPNGSYLESGESRYENVWTAYPRSLFADETDYTITNDVTWTVTPIDRPEEATHKDAQARIAYRNPSPVAFVAAPGHYIIEKETLEPHRYPTSTNTALTDLRGLGTGDNAVAPKDTTIGFVVTGYGEIMERTLDEGASIADVTDPATDPNLHQRYVTMEVTDDALYLNGNYASELTSADYYVSRVHLGDPRVYTYAHKGGDVNNEWDYLRDYEAAPLPDVALWGLSENAGGTAQEWTKLATVTYDQDNVRTVTAVADGVTVDGTNVHMGKDLGITRVKVVTSSKSYDAIRLQYNPYVTLRADGPRVQALVGELFATSDSPTATLRNDVTLAAYNGDGVNGTYDSDDADAPTVDPADASLVSGEGGGIFAARADGNQSVGFSRTLAMDTARYGRPMFHYASHAYLRGAVPHIGVTSTKSMEYDPTTDLNTSTMQATLHYTSTVHEQSNVLSQEVYEEYVQSGAIAPETSGTWYDLLPPGVSPVMGTIRLRDQDSVLDAYTIENYQDTGRALLVVQAELVPQLKYNDVVEGASAGEGYWSQGVYDAPTISFDAVYSFADYEAITDGHGDEVDKLVNIIAFESGNEELGNQEGMMGEYDDATGGTGDTKVYRNKETSVAVEDTPDLPDGRAAQVMSNLDGSLVVGYKKPTFVYARDETSITVDRSSVSSISKTVASDAEGVYRTGTSDTDAAQGWPNHDNQVNVYEGHGYSYRIQVAHGSGQTSNIVLYDALENYQLNSSNSDYSICGQRWKGTLVSVDTSQLKAAGVAPVVYYSTTVGSFDSRGADAMASANDSGLGVVSGEYQQNTDLTNASKWTPASNFSGSLSSVTAIAIDCSEATDGSGFVLPEKGSLVAYVHMKAPTEVVTEGASNLFRTINPDGSEDEPNNNSHAFNNVYIMSDVKGESDTNAQTEFYHPDYVKVGIVPYKLQVSKIWDDANNNDGKRPDSVTVHLLANGQTAKDENGGDVPAVRLDDANEWTHTFDDIPYVDGNNTPIHYTVTEDPITEDAGDGTTVRLYAPSYLHTDDTHISIVNKRAPATVDVRGTKTWEDNGDAAGARPSTIQVRLYADGKYKDTKRVAEATDGTWSYEFTGLPAYKDGQKIVYTVEEEPVDFYAADYAASSAGSGSVVADDGTIQGSTDITNTYSTTGLLGIAKTTEGAISDAGRNASFAFKIELFSDQTDALGNAIPLADSYPYYVVDAATGNKVDGSDGTVTTGGTVSVKGGQRAIIAGIPVGSTYRVTEQATPGFRQSATANTTGTIKAGVNADHAADASFTNTYSTSGSFQLKATKKLQNQKLELYGFRFQAYRVFNEGTADEYEQVVRSVSNGAGGPMDASGVSTGDVTFARVNVTGDDLGSDGTLELLYRIREVNAGKNGYTYATNVEQVRVKLTDAGDGTITATQTPEVASGTSHIRSLDGTTTTESAFVSNGDATFTNTYAATGTLELSAFKVLKGRALTADEFEFTLAPLTEGAPTAATMTAKNDASGVVAFPAITLTGAHGGKSFVYKITEDAGSDSGVVYSNEAVYYRVDVTDNGDGTMSSTQTVVAPKADAEASAVAAGDPSAFEPTELSPTITNTLKPGSLQITKLVDSTSTEHADQEFTFRVRLTGPDLADSYTYSVGSTTSLTTQSMGAAEPVVGPVAGASEAASSETTPLSAQGTQLRATSIPASTTWGDCTVAFDSATGAVTVRPTNGTSATFARVSSKWPWTEYGDDDKAQIKTIIFADGVSPGTTCAYMFSGLTGLESINFGQTWDTSSVNNMTETFKGCAALTSLDLSSWTTNSVDYFAGMFSGCTSLETLDISSFSVASGIYDDDAAGMFDGCVALKEVALGPSFNFIKWVELSNPLPEHGATELYTANWINSTDANATGMTVAMLGNTWNGATMSGVYVWEPQNTAYTVLFNANGGAGSMSSQTMPASTGTALKGNTFVRNDMQFAGWNTKGDGTGFSVGDGATVTATDLGATAGKTVTLYAQWSEGSQAQLQDGVLEIKIKPGQKATIEGIPAGTTYQVFEDTVAGWQLVSQSGTSGTIEPLGTGNAVFTNQYDSGETKVQLYATKTLDGASASTPFEFVLTGTAGAPMPSNATDGSVTVANDATGLVDFGSIAYDTPGTYTYSIAEKTGADNTIVYDASEWTATVTVTNAGTDTDPVLSAAVSYFNGMDEASATPPTFANTTKPGELKVKKVGVNVTPANKDAEFDFTVQLQNDGQPVDKASYYIENADGTPLTTQSEGAEEQGGANPLSALGRVATGAADSLAHLFTPRVAYAEVTDSGTFGEGGSCTWEWDQGTSTITVRATNEGTVGEWKDAHFNATTYSAPWAIYDEQMEATYEEQMEHFVVAKDSNNGTTVAVSGSSNMSEMFRGLTNLKTVDLSGFDMTNYGSADSAYFAYVFAGSTNLTSVELPVFDGYPIAINHLFDGCTNLTEISIPQMFLRSGNYNQTSDFAAFNNCTSLPSIDLSGITIQGTMRLDDMFYGCSSLTDVNMNIKESGHITHAMRMFYGCSNLRTINFKGFDASGLESISYMFRNCTSLTDLDLTDWNATALKEVNGAFWGCHSLRSLDISTLGFENVIEDGSHDGAKSMLREDTNLSKIIIGSGFRDLTQRSFSNYPVNTPPRTGGYRGNWVMVEDTTKVKTYEQLMASDGRTDAGTWVWQVDPDYYYVINFKTNGAYYDTNNNAVPGSVTKDVADSITLPTPRWDTDAKTFAGWYREADFSGTKFDGGATYNRADLFGENQTTAYVNLYAKWVDNTSTTGTINVYKESVANDSTYVLDTSREYTFTQPVGQTETITPEDIDGFITPDAQNVTVAQDATVNFYYDRVAYTVKFNANATDATGEMADLSMVGGVAKKLTPNAFTREGYTFLGWNTAADGSGTSYTDQAQVKNLAANGETVTLYAQWAAGSSSTSSTGTYTFKLKAGQRVHFTNVPAGTRYSVVESTELPNGWTQTATNDTTGTVPANNVAAATVTNTYNATGVVSLEASKAMRSGSLSAGQFSFQLKDEGGTVLQTVTNLEPEEGTATGQILFDPLEYQLSDLFQDGVYVGPKTYTYTIAEVVPEGADEQTIDGNTVYTSGGVIYGADGVRSHTVTVEVADSGTGSLTVTPSASTASIGFINDYEPGSLEVAKTTTGTNEASSDAKFTFSVKLTDAQGAAVNRSYDLVRIAADGTQTTETNGAQFTNGTAAIADVGNGERFRIEGIAKDAAYEVTEFGVPGGFTQSAVSGDKGTIGAGQVSTASFTNAYEAEGSVALQANKTLEDGNIADYTFTFQLYDETNKLLQTKTNDATGVVTFDELGYSAADAGTRENPKKYTYKIAEVNDAQKNVAYDTHSGWLDVKVWDEGTGELTVQAVYDHAVGDPSTTPETFANKILHPIEMPTTGGNGWAIPIAAAAIVATAEAARRMRRRQRNESKS